MCILDTSLKIHVQEDQSAAGHNTVNLCKQGWLVSFQHASKHIIIVFYKESVSTPCVTECALVLCGPICWLMLIIQIRRRKTTTQSSSMPSTLLSGPGSDSSGEAKDMAAPNPQTATLNRNSNTRPPMFPSHRTRKSRKRGVSHK